MIIFQVIALGFVATALSLVVKKQSSEFGLFISIVSGVLIFFMVISQLQVVIQAIEDIASKIHIDATYMKIIFKIIGIAYISEFAGEVCKDAGEKAIAMKIEFAGKVIILVVSMPILLTLLDLISNLLV